MKPIRIMLVEDHFLARFGLRGLITDQHDMTVVAEGKSVADVLPLFVAHLPDVVLMDLALPDGDGIDATASLCEQHPQAQVLVVTNSDGSHVIARALNAGAQGFVRKDIEGDDLLGAIRAIANGTQQGPYLPEALAKRLAQGIPNLRLTPREGQLLEHLSRGLANKDVATLMELSEGSVRIYVSRLLAKLNAASRTEAVAIARDAGLLGHSR